MADASDTHRAIWNADDLILLSQVADAGSFSAAARVTGIQKARLSRRIAMLESALGVRLIERTTRSFRVTDVGEQLRTVGSSMLEQAELARSLVNNVSTTPSGVLSIACPVVLAELFISTAAVSFAKAYPDVRVTFDVVTYDEETQIGRYDIILLPAMDGRLRDSTTVTRRVMLTPFEVVATPQWIEEAGHPSSMADLEGKTGIGWWNGEMGSHWTLQNEAGETANINVVPSFVTNNLVVARVAALNGLGMARLPRVLCMEAMEVGLLQRVVPDISLAPITVYVGYPSRRSLTAAGRAFLAILEKTLA
jgi:DNA-binding transcriptional LysR family regulator